MELLTIPTLLTNYKYLIVINCTITKDWEFKHIPSFTTNKTSSYLIKNISDVQDIIKEIFLVWRYKFHSNSDISTRDLNNDYMELLLNQVDNIGIFSYLDYNIESGIDSSINCSFKIYQMRDEFINLLDLTDPVKYETPTSFKHRILSYIVFKDKNPNRLEIHIQNPQYITTDINQTIGNLHKIYDLEFYQDIFKKVGLQLVNTDNFMKSINSDKSFILTINDFKSDNEILYSNIYFFI